MQISSSTLSSILASYLCVAVAFLSLSNSVSGLRISLPESMSERELSNAIDTDSRVGVGLKLKVLGLPVSASEPAADDKTNTGTTYQHTWGDDDDGKADDEDAELLDHVQDENEKESGGALVGIIGHLRSRSKRFIPKPKKSCGKKFCKKGLPCWAGPCLLCIKKLGLCLL